MIRNVTVYCASSRTLAENYRQAAGALGRAIALKGWGVIYGGDRAGLMGQLADGACEAGGKVIGIMPERLMKPDVINERCDEMVVARDMRHRKGMLEDRCDAMIALPGGLGTLEEFFEVVVGRQLGYHNKPIVLLNVAKFYDPLLAMIEHGIEHRFIKPECRELFFVAESVEQAIGYLSRCDAE
ncbi:MAG TPA: TIGR00730 family Rossman fold protein [Tepidisphaeraceae bacterium]|jgi:hypothetical protein|nr:TIGR00730 family Rossman fold protein [Tepidisphaeraceae bacterium]